VRVRILTNSLASTDNFEAFSGYQRDRAKVLETGAEVYEWKPDARIRYGLMNPEVQAAINYTAAYGMHSKSMVIDGETAVIGSYNLDPRSVNYNSECFVIVRSTAFADLLSLRMEAEFQPEYAWRITPAFNPDKASSFNKRIKSQSRKVIPKRIL
jgi:phosphatidylserine/phosphatidylglycerophosphate/cardiolipin synthase-like enzyme